MRARTLVGRSIMHVDNAPGRTADGRDASTKDDGEERCNQAWLHKRM
jgi:hypothetical protein